MAYIQPNPNGQATKANSSPVVLASDQDALAVTAASLPLPTGAATESTLGNVLTTSDFDTKTGSLTETAPATDTASSGLNGRLQRIAQRLSSLIGLLPTALGANGGLKIEGVASGTVVPISGTITANAGSNLNTSALALDATLTGGTQQSKITDGTNVATVKAASTAAAATDKALVVAISPNNTVPVSLATNTPTLQSGSTTAVTQATGSNLHTVVDSGTVTANADLTATGSITTQNLAPTGVATAGSAVSITGLSAMASASVQVTGTYTGALSAQATVDGTNWITLGGTPFVNINTGAYSATIASAATGIFQVDVAGFKQFRISGLAAMTGTAVVSIQTSSGAGMVALDAPLPTGTNVIGALSANQSTNVAQVAGTTTDVNSGVKSNGTLRVVLATDQPALTNKLLVTPDSVALPANQSVNVSQINAVTPLMGNGASGTGAQRVTIANDSTGILATVTSLTQMNGAAIAMGTGTRSAGTQRVTIATDDVVPASQSGTWTVQPGNTANTTPWLVQDTPATAGGLTYTTNSIKATATSLKASAGQVYGWYIFNSNTSAVYVQFFNTLVGSVTLGTTPPVYTLGIPAGAAANVMVPHGILHTTAIVIAATTTATGLTAPTNNVDINVFIK